MNEQKPAQQFVNALTAIKLKVYSKNLPFLDFISPFVDTNLSIGESSASTLTFVLPHQAQGPNPSPLTGFTSFRLQMRDMDVWYWQNTMRLFRRN